MAYQKQRPTYYNDPYNDPYRQQDPWNRPRTAERPMAGPQDRYRDYPPQWARRRRRGAGCCFPILFFAGLLGLLFLAYLVFPSRTNVLVLGIDYTTPDNAVGRSDTIILTTVNPLQPYVGMLSIPRDLWLVIPGIGENRINTAHYFAESQQAGSGPFAAMQTVRQNFGVDVGYFIRIRFDGFREVVNALGGVDIVLPEPMAGYEAGSYHLTGNKALAFVRHRQGSDDFFRMENGQFMMKAILRQMANPVKWPRLPLVAAALSRSIDTNLPVWTWPRLGFALLRAGPDGIDNRTISREMVSPLITDQGADVLIPNWNLINPVLMEMFGQ